MRTPNEIKAEMDSLGAPPVQWRPIAALQESLAAKRTWRTEHPDLSVRMDALQAELEATEANEREVVNARRLAARLEAAGLGGRSADAAAQPEERPALKATRQWLSSPKTWLLLAGDTRTGKTVAAGWAMREIAIQGHSVALARAAAVARLSGFDAGAAELERLKRIALLVLDDLGTECATGWGSSILHELLDSRHEAKRRTIITTNLKRADARKHLGDRLAERVKEDGLIFWLEGRVEMRRPA